MGTRDGGGALVDHAEGDVLGQRVVDELVARRDYLRKGYIDGLRLLVDEEEEVDVVAQFGEPLAGSAVVHRVVVYRGRDAHLHVAERGALRYSDKGAQQGVCVQSRGRHNAFAGVVEGAVAVEVDIGRYTAAVAVDEVARVGDGDDDAVGGAACDVADGVVGVGEVVAEVGVGTTHGGQLDIDVVERYADDIDTV